MYAAQDFIEYPEDWAIEYVVGLLEEHSLNVRQFFDDHGENRTYSSDEVLIWMGY